MDHEHVTLDKSYDPAPIEDKWYSKWIENGLFKCDPDSPKPPFSIVIPPPNVTGSLHVGHALDETLQDILCRFKRMQGYDVLWMPGTDHAGIATQNVVERHLAAQGISRHDLGREAFVEKVWEWKEQYGSTIINQLKKLGASCDWERERFTMDEGLSKAVRHVFVTLYEKDLIYRGKYLINWCPRCLTALSDLEVEHSEQEGKLYKVSYPFKDQDGDIVVMTTRPETILGDVAIAVHPRDERNSHLVGRTVIAPLTGREIPIIEDNMVDPEFGTGAVKITPAHDANDFLVGQRHNLEQIQVIDDKGIMNEQAGEFCGLDRFEARERIAERLEQEGRLLGIDDHANSVGHCYRCQTIIEPYLSEQWFVRTAPLAKVDVEAVKEGRIRFVPEQWENTYFQWMENIRDWCISRQLWWGHRIPAWYCQECGSVIVSAETPTACKCGSTHLKQDEDVLDTWFSSALWPFSTMHWPEQTKELKKYYPTSVLVTGFDIIFFWVARMIMMGIEFMGDVPFKDVYIHALVRDEKGQKMSKSKGNVIDPLIIVEKHGADALRLTMAALALQGRDISLSNNRIETYRFFMNKLWNASRFALMNLEGATPQGCWDESQLRLHDRWILQRLDDVIQDETRLLEGYSFGEAARLMYDFVWGELCDWYLELAKPALRGDEGEARKNASQQVLFHVFENVLKLLHPVVPFVTEELWHAFPFGGDFINRAHWPTCADRKDFASVESMLFLQRLIREMRNLRAEAGFSPQQRAPKMVIIAQTHEILELIKANVDLVKMITRVDVIDIEPAGAIKPKKSLAAVFEGAEVAFPVGDLLDVPKEVARLESELVKVQKEIEKSEKKLGNSDFIARAPQDIVEKERLAVEDGKARQARINENIRSLKED